MFRLFPVLAVFASAVAADDRSQWLKVEASTPVVAIAAGNGERRFISLPDLDYEFRLQSACPSGWEPARLSLSVADTRASLAPPASATALRLTVPAAQIAPLPVSTLCADAADDAGITVPAVLSAQAALVCTSGDSEQTAWTSTALAITLTCAAVDAATPALPGSI